MEYLDSVRNAHPQLSDWCNLLSNLYRMKSWQQLTSELDNFVLLPHFQTGDDLINLSHNFINHFETEINPIALARFTVRVSHQYPDTDAAINYLKEIIEKLQSTKQLRIKELIIYINMQIALFNLVKRDHKECKNLLDNGKTTLNKMIGVHPSVYGHYYWVLCQYNIFHQDPDEFNKNIILSLAYTPLESMSESHKLYIAFHITVSAMLGDNIYNFGELLWHPIMKDLLDSPFEWIYHILEAFNSGNLVRYQQLYKIHNTCLSLQAHLIEGVIDEVDGTVHVTWIKPRHLVITQIEYFRHQLANWLSEVQCVIISMETEIGEFLKM